MGRFSLLLSEHTRFFFPGLPAPVFKPRRLRGAAINSSGNWPAICLVISSLAPQYRFDDHVLRSSADVLELRCVDHPPNGSPEPARSSQYRRWPRSPRDPCVRCFNPISLDVFQTFERSWARLSRTSLFGMDVGSGVDSMSLRPRSSSSARWRAAFHRASSSAHTSRLSGSTAVACQKSTAQQLRGAFPGDTAPRYLLRDRDRISAIDSEGPGAPSERSEHPDAEFA